MLLQDCTLTEDVWSACSPKPVLQRQLLEAALAAFEGLRKLPEAVRGPEASTQLMSCTKDGIPGAGEVVDSQHRQAVCQRVRDCLRDGRRTKGRKLSLVIPGTFPTLIGLSITLVTIPPHPDTGALQCGGKSTL